MTFVVDGTNGLTFPNSTTQASSSKVLQVVQGTYTTTVSTTSTTFVTTNITASITPLIATSKILVSSNIPCYINASTGELHLAIYRNNTTNIFGTDASDLFSNGGAVISNQGLCYLDSPSTTSSTSYTVYMRRDTTGTAYSCVNSNMATITLMEIAA